MPGFYFVRWFSCKTTLQFKLHVTFSVAEASWTMCLTWQFHCICLYFFFNVNLNKSHTLKLIIIVSHSNSVFFWPCMRQVKSLQHHMLDNALKKKMDHCPFQLMPCDSIPFVNQLTPSVRGRDNPLFCYCQVSLRRNVSRAHRALKSHSGIVILILAHSNFPFTCC